MSKSTLCLNMEYHQLPILYVDDLQVSFKSRNLSICERQVHPGVYKLTSQAVKNGFKPNSGSVLIYRS